MSFLSFNSVNSGKKRYSQGVYGVKNRQKYIGDPNEVFYLSSWEYSFFLKLDENPSVKRWCANTLKIPYIFEVDGHRHDYYLDAYVEMVTGEKFLFEIKPDKELSHPIPPKRRNQKALSNYNNRVLTFHKNRNKWLFAANFARQNGYMFVIITERARYTIDPKTGTIIEVAKARTF